MPWYLWSPPEYNSAPPHRWAFIGRLSCNMISASRGIPSTGTQLPPREFAYCATWVNASLPCREIWADSLIITREALAGPMPVSLRTMFFYLSYQLCLFAHQSSKPSCFFPALLRIELYKWFDRGSYLLPFLWRVSGRVWRWQTHHYRSGMAKFIDEGGSQGYCLLCKNPPQSNAEVKVFPAH